MKNATEKILQQGGYIKADKLYDSNSRLRGTLNIAELNMLPGYLKTHDGRTYYISI